MPTTLVALMPLSTTLGRRKLRIPPKTRSYKAMVTKLPIDSGQSSIAITGSGPCAVALRVFPVDGDYRYQGVPGGARIGRCFRVLKDRRPGSSIDS